jgi:hypothetical protein
MTPPRNAPCLCGSGTKCKKCCGSEVGQRCLVRILRTLDPAIFEVGAVYPARPSGGYPAWRVRGIDGGWRLLHEVEVERVDGGRTP